MVFLRLTVKVYSPGQLSVTPIPRRSSREDTESSNGVSLQPVSFLLGLQRPEEVTLRALAGMIQEKWTKLRPSAP
jgi:hypothetical protein